MGIFGGIFGKGDETTNDSAKLRLRKEELDIDKSRIQKGEVELSKEIVEEQKIVDVPVTREEVVIERRTLDNELSDSPITDEETIRIPVSEEKINVDKHTVITGEISAHKRVIEDTEHIEETLRREEARVNKIGNPDVVDNSTTQD
ncbi:uncharacterized protein (TIGR02271 family) [Anaerosolibacter carboniphilus]|uniref:Uncharacterized protein (TIGR02271 family) n=1 Tax=Anaerosolibacter carboniphilus TaxID=1417629 RepID=A0A841KX34_9FIRM|nr:YsnF/AvaK domain-containing protein [Anaerosolibacter carboniphilus]MBB6216570.1 uncharacterized protein (TIGR02271 family) [Anaerosolibacter carboniphilus]